MSKLLKFSFLILLIAFVACSEEDDSEGAGNPIAGNRLSTGDSARDFLSDETFDELIVEVVYVEGFRPTDASLNNLLAFIEERCHKPGGVELNVRSFPSPNIEQFNIQQVDSIEKVMRSQYNLGNKMALYVSFLDGQFEDDSDDSVVLGAAYRNTSFVIFEETLHRFSDGVNEPDRFLLESTVFRHEFAHLLGLVDLGTEMQTDHLDSENGNHCNVESCLMNYKIESGINIPGMASEENIPVLDSQCLADLRANGGK
ncbi:membrane metalloprotease [Galbibacter mesophilus]|uniref:membrane metalloprotease n=1 Tax=Galbibacter mesophilus TaxID=379069 RepID=UPI001F5C5D37|nr:membrane metalloprotease [Galbibacter mesophilus]MCM5664365.1 membrane metalloprotease [Galbibacter mesophilus]